MHQTHPSTRQPRKVRAISMALVLALLLGLVPGLDLSGSGSAHWADSYLSQLVEWGFIRPDQSQEPAEELTRADFMAITNRAYGYHEPGPTPFEDIAETDWFYDDVGIAYTAKYIKGTSETTASPNETLTRETAATILGRNMMLDESEGEILDFTDARDISFWSKGVIKSSLEHYLVSGYDDGTFRPQSSVTWGEMAAMVTRIVGTPLQEAGDYSLGGVFGNVTITASGVTLRDTVISGDLYVTGGVGLGDIQLENVTVLGRIICSGTGEAEAGNASILLRNVTADELLIDNLEGKTVSVQADGITEIGKTTVRTSAYVEDNTMEGLGLKAISVEGHAPGEDDGGDAGPVALTLAGRIENVVNKTPESLIHVGKGTVSKLTVDEAAVGSQVTIDRNAEVKELNLDVATLVDGDGDIKNLNVNAPGCEVTILPEKITIRPGTTAEINGEEMDTTAAEETNRAPMILSGYPSAEDIAPNSITAVFAANKKGTIYWAVSPLASGSVSAADLIKPPVYGAISVARGSVKIAAPDSEVRSAVTRLTPGNSYYLSAIMVDERGVQSTMKVISFSTPDNTVPAFCKGYPRMSSTSVRDGCQVVVMPTKSCNMYYVLLPEGAAAPTEEDLKNNSISGALGYGMVPVTKNEESVVRVDDVTLEETKNYVLYLWLVDADGTNKSRITSLTFTTKDETPPEFVVHPSVNNAQAKNVRLNFRLNEKGTVYWAVVPAGTEYPKKQPGHDTVNLSDQWAKLQVQNGYSAMASGSVAANPDRDGTINISGLQAETSYDLYYVAVDAAGNYSVEVKKITVNTLDVNGPVITQTFTRYSGLDNTTNPMVDTGIVLKVTENVRANVEGAGEDLLSLYQTATDRHGSTSSRQEALEKLVLSLRNSIVLNIITSGTGQGSRPVAVKGDDGVDDNWVVDYEKVTVTRKDGAVEITFPPEALQLDSGNTYYFTVSNLTDNSSAQNPIVPSTIDFYTNAAAGQAAGHDLRPFTTMLGQFYMTRTGLDAPRELPTRTSGSGETAATETVPVDFSFRVVPRATKKMDASMCYDLVFFVDAIVAFDLYYRVIRVDENGANPTIIDLSTDTAYQLPNWAGNATPAGDAGWYRLGNSELIRGSTSALGGVTLNGQFNNCNQGNFPKLNSLDDDSRTYYEFAVSLTQKDSSANRTEWNNDVNLTVHAAAAPSTNLSSLTRRPTPDRWDDRNNTAVTNKNSFLYNGLSNGGGVSIGITDQSQSFLRMNQPFTDSRIPKFDNGYPHITPGDTFVDLELALDQTSAGSTISYVIAPVGGINPKVLDHRTDPNANTALSDSELWELTPRNGSANQPGLPNTTEITPQTPAAIVSPEKVAIAEHMYDNDAFKMGTIAYNGNNERVPVTEKGLLPKTDYYVYFVFSNVSDEMSDIYMYRFTTSDLAKPMIHLARASGIVNARTHVASVMDYTMATSSQVRQMDEFSNKPEYRLSQHAIAPAGGKRIPENYLSMSVLDAMISPYTVSMARENVTGEHDAEYSEYYIPDYTQSTATLGYSVFDVYARDSIKEEVAQLIRNGSSVSGYLANGSKNTNTSPTPIDETKKMSSGTPYILLTVAHHESGEIDSFKAIDNVVLPDEAPPKPIRINTYIPDGGIKEGAQRTLYSGTVTVEFDKDLYWLPKNASSSDMAVPVFGTNERNPEGGVSILDKTSTNAKELTMQSDTGYQTTTTFIMNFTDISANGEITIFNNGYFANAGGTAETTALVLTFTERGKQVGFTTTWRGVEQKLQDINPQEEKLVISNSGGVNLVGNTVTLTQGQYSDLYATLDPNPDSYRYSWSCDDQNIVLENSVVKLTPSDDGRRVHIEPVGMGIAKLTVKAGQLTQYITVTVNGSVVVTRPNGQAIADGEQVSIMYNGGRPVELTCTTNPATGLVWSSSAPGIAVVDGITENGITTGATITPKFLGTSSASTVITLTAPGGMVVKRFQVLVTAQRTGPDASGFNVKPKK